MGGKTPPSFPPTLAMWHDSLPFHHPSEPHAMKCPYCGADAKQRQRGEIKQKQTAVKLPPLVLWHCGNCAFLYTTQPALAEKGDAPRPAKTT